MSFSALATPEVRDLIDRMASEEKLTLLVGAGASMEAGLPSWKALLERLLGHVAAEMPDLETDEQRTSWVSETLVREDLLGAGAVVEVMARENLDVLVPDQLYGGRGPGDYAPGPIAHQVAQLKKVYGPSMEIFTTNYDDLIEQALIGAGTAPSLIRSYVRYRPPASRSPGVTAVTHLHGLAGRRGGSKRIILTEEHYQRMQHGTSWQERRVTEQLTDAACLFVGMSLSDPNLIRYLYGYKPDSGRRHAAIFVRQGEQQMNPSVRSSVEEGARRRWGRCGVDAVFVDHYSDAAQMLFEIGHRKVAGGSYVPVDTRASEYLGYAARGLAVDEPERFARIQVGISSVMRTTLKRLLSETLESVDLELDETLALGLWLMTDDGKGLVGWAHSDRAHQDPETVQPVDVQSESKWVSVQTVCRGTRVEFDRETYASRWRFVRGLPLVLNLPARLPVGCLTISSSKSSAESVLTQMPEDARATLHRVLRTMGQILVEDMIKGGQPNPSGPLARPIA